MFALPNEVYNEKNLFLEEIFLSSELSPTEKEGKHTGPEVIELFHAQLNWVWNFSC